MENSKNHTSLGVSKAIKKETGAAAAAHRQARVYNIRRSDFRTVVQQLTGAPSAALPRQRRLHQARPPPLSPVPRAAPVDPLPLPPLAAATAASSPISAYMRFLETSLLHSDGSHRPGAGSPLRPPPRAPAAQQLELIQSPSAFLNLVSPRCPPVSPQPLSFSPSMLFPSSPSAFLLASPSTWKDL